MTKLQKKQEANSFNSAFFRGPYCTHFSNNAVCLTILAVAFAGKAHPILNITLYSIEIFLWRKY